MRSIASARRTNGGRIRSSALWLGALALLFSAGGCATRGSIQGTLLPPTASPDSLGRKPGPRRVTDAVVFLVPEPPVKPPPGDGGRKRMLQTHGGFEPFVIAVPAGTTVVFENRDRVYHNAFSVSPAKHFDTGLYAPGQKRVVEFDTPGVVDVYCELHPESAGFVLVLPDHLYARPDSRGKFRLAPVPEGSYLVTAWHPLFGETSGRVQITRSGRATLRLAF